MLFEEVMPVGWSEGRDVGWPSREGALFEPEAESLCDRASDAEPRPAIGRVSLGVDVLPPSGAPQPGQEQVEAADCTVHVEHSAAARHNG